MHWTYEDPGIADLGSIRSAADQLDDQAETYSFIANQLMSIVEARPAVWRGGAALSWDCSATRVAPFCQKRVDACESGANALRRYAMDVEQIQSEVASLAVAVSQANDMSAHVAQMAQHLQGSDDPTPREQRQLREGQTQMAQAHASIQAKKDQLEAQRRDADASVIELLAETAAVLAARMTHPVSGTLITTASFNSKASSDAVSKAKQAMASLANETIGEVVNGSVGEFEALAKAIRDLSKEELNEFLSGLSDAELKSLGRLLDRDWAGLWGGVSAWDRQEIVSSLMRNADAAQVERIYMAFPMLNPGHGWRAALGLRIIDWVIPSGSLYGPLNEYGRPEKADWKYVYQGGLGDCWLGAGIASLVKYDPTWVRSHIKDNYNGTVSVLLYDKSGNEQWVTVEKRLPQVYNQDTGKMEWLGMRGSTDWNGNSMEALWPAYLEKAIAQVYDRDSAGMKAGDYQVVEGDNATNAWAILTGKTGQNLSVNDIDAITSAVQDGIPVVISTFDEQPEGSPGNYVPNHAYFVKGFDADGKLILGNPWGQNKPDLHVTLDEATKWFSGASIYQ